MSTWQPIATAPLDGRPIWARGDNWGKPEQGQHFDWAYWNGVNWCAPGTEGEHLLFLTHWMSQP